MSRRASESYLGEYMFSVSKHLLGAAVSGEELAQSLHDHGLHTRLSKSGAEARRPRQRSSPVNRNVRQRAHNT